MSRREELQHSMAALEAQRAILGDAVVEPALAALRKELAALETPPAEPDLDAALRRLVPQTYAERLLAACGHADPERRLVTILFSDVKGSTAMAETLDPEEVLEIMNGAFEFLIQPIYQHEGTLARLMGDAILAFFGAPLAHENDPERAVIAALEIVAGAQEYAARLAAERGIQGFNVRVGINTGLVVMGEVGSDLRVEYTAMGDAINLAARMEQNAPIGGILISHATYRLVQGLFETAAQPPLLVKGKTEPIQTYVVQRAKPRAFRMGTRGIEGLEIPMVGRDAELTQLQAAWAAAQTGGARVCIVVGDAGLGKSRLLYEFQRRLLAEAPAPRILKGRAVPETVSAPYGLLYDLFARHWNVLDSDDAESAREKIEAGLALQLAPERAHVVGHWLGFDLSTTPAVQKLAGAPALAIQAQADLLAYLRALSAARPVVMFLDDLHWADAASLDFIAKMMTELTAQRLLLIGLTRPMLYERLPDWRPGGDTVQLPLYPLTPEDSHALVAALLQKVAALPETLRALIVAQAEGNPFYVEELIKMLLDEGIIARHTDAWQVDAARLGMLKVPATLTGVLQARLDGLPPEEKELLQRASVVGRNFWDTLLLEFNPLELEALRALLGAIAAREMIYPRETSIFAQAREYLFKHIMLRDVVYETVLLKLRRRYHEQAARWLEAQSGDRVNEHANLIGEHYARAGVAERACLWFERAGRAAHTASAYQEAERAYRRALEFAAPVQRGALLVALANSLEKTARYDEAIQALEEGIPLARDHSPKDAAHGLTNLSWIHTLRGEHEQAFTYAEQALALAQQLGDRRELGRARMRYCATHPDYDVAANLACLGQVREDFVAAEDAMGEAVALLNMGNTSLDLGDLEQATQYYRASQALFQAQGNRWGLGNCAGNLGLVLSRQGDRTGALQYYADGLRIAQEIGDGEGVVLMYQNMAAVYLVSEDYAQAEHYAWRSFQQALRLGLFPLALINLLNLGEIALLQGDYPLAAERLGTVQAQLALFPDLSAELERLLGAIAAHLSADSYETALAQGCARAVESWLENDL